MVWGGVLFILTKFTGIYLNKFMGGFDLQDEADDSNAPHVRLQAHRLIVDHLWGHKLRRSMHHQEGFILL